MTSSTLPRGVRNNNPGNIVKGNDKWQGLAEEQIDPRFLTFKDPVYGIRAIARLLIRYQDEHGCKTPNDFISRWAPAKENDTKAYTNAVVYHLNSVSADYGLHGTSIDMHVYGWLRGMVEAIIEHENGHPWMELYTNAQIDKALTLSGVEPPKKSVVASRQVIGTTAAATGGSIAQVITSTQDQLSPFITYIDWVKYVAIALALAGLALTIYAKWDERRKGIS